MIITGLKLREKEMWGSVKIINHNQMPYQVIPVCGYQAIEVSEHLIKLPPSEK